VKIALKRQLSEAYLSGDNSDLWNSCLGISVQKLGTMTDNATMLLMCSCNIERTASYLTAQATQGRGLCSAFSFLVKVYRQGLVDQQP